MNQSQHNKSIVSGQRSDNTSIRDSLVHGKKRSQSLNLDDTNEFSINNEDFKWSLYKRARSDLDLYHIEEVMHMEEDDNDKGKRKDDDLTLFQMINPLNYIKQKFQPGGIKGTIFTLLSATLGAGMLAMPRAFMESGITFSVIQLIFCALISYTSLISLVHCSQKVKLYTFGQLAYYVYGTPFKIFTEFCNIMFVFGTAISYSVYLKENLVQSFKFIQQTVWSDMPSILYDPQSILWVVLLQFLVTPLTLKKEISYMRFLSILSFLVITYVSLLIVIYAFVPGTNNVDRNITQLQFFKLKGASYTFPIICFSFCCQPNVLQAYSELKKPSVRRMQKVFTRQIFLCCSIYLFVGLYGYFTFPFKDQGQQSNFLTRYEPTTHIPVLIAIVIMTAVIFVAQPFNIIPCQESIYSLIYPNKDQSRCQHYIYTLTIHLLQTAISGWAVHANFDMESLLGYVSGISSPLICFVVPFIMFLGIFKKSRTFTGMMYRYFLYFLTIFFSLFTVGTVVSWFY